MKTPVRRLTPILIILYAALCLSACGRQPREAEQLLIVEAMGLDRAAEGVRLTLASGAGAGPEDAPVRLEARAPSVTAAIEKIRAGANEEELFCAHVGHLLIGEAAAAEGLSPFLDYVCRSDELRLSVPLYILRGGEAGTAVLSVGNDSYGVSDALRAVAADLRARGDGHSTSAAEVMRDLARRGGALVCAVAMQPSAEDDRSAGADEQPLMLCAAGYAVIREDRLCGWLDRDLAVAVGLLTGRSGLCEILVTDQAGLPVTLSLLGGSAEIRPGREADGSLSGLNIEVRVRAVLAEGAGGRTEPWYLQQMLEHELAGRIRELLRLSKSWSADFLGLGEQIRAGEDFSARWPELPVTVSVSAKLLGTGDLEEGP